MLRVNLYTFVKEHVFAELLWESLNMFFLNKKFKTELQGPA